MPKTPIAALAFAGVFLSCPVDPLHAAPSPGPAGAPSAETAVIQALPVEPENEASSPTGAIRIQVDWSTVRYQTTERLFSVAGFQAGNPEVVSRDAYRKGLEHMGIGSLRYHSAESMRDVSESPNGWLDRTNQTWAADRIRTAVAGWNPPGVQKSINIIGWPAWMDTDKNGYLDDNQTDAFAAFCAEMVRLVNTEAKLGIPYFEITNEKDGLYWIDPQRQGKPHRIDELADIYLRAARAMKKEDPGLKTGGPAAQRPDRNEPLLAWAKAVLPELDFLSVHMYASGDPADPDIHIWDRTEAMGRATRQLRKALDEMSPDRHIELHVNEYNISWTWKTREVRMTNHIGGVFDALAMVEMAEGGADVIQAWNECDGIYGKMDNEHRLRSGAHVLHLFNRFLVGDVVASTSGRKRQVVPYAVRGKNGESILLINRTDRSRTVVLTQAIPPIANGKILQFQVDANGFNPDGVPLTSWPATLDLSPASVTLLNVSPGS
ncbi:MAG: hypothetical protein SFU53_05805 [Terrimicrobiaceae bacterium]|nr:hypothetical protein [Terrimicrobiaceae bacterium]